VEASASTPPTSVARSTAFFASAFALAWSFGQTFSKVCRVWDGVSWYKWKIKD